MGTIGMLIFLIPWFMVIMIMQCSKTFDCKN